VWEGEGREGDEAMEPDAAIVEARDARESCEVVEWWHASEPTDAPAVLPADDGATRGVAPAPASNAPDHARFHGIVCK